MKGEYDVRLKRDVSRRLCICDSNRKRKFFSGYYVNRVNNREKRAKFFCSGLEDIYRAPTRACAQHRNILNLEIY